MCNSTVPTIPNDPNAAVERHILSGTCAGMPGGEERKRAELKRKKEAGEVCWRKGCNKTLVVPMKCDQCSHLFCPTHRHTTSHTCSPNPTPFTSRNGTPKPLISKPAGKSAMSRLLASATASTSSSSNPPSSQPSSAPLAQAPPASIPNSAQPVKAAQADPRSAAATAALKRAGQDVKVPFVKTKTEK